MENGARNNPLGQSLNPLWNVPADPFCPAITILLDDATVQRIAEAIGALMPKILDDTVRQLAKRGVPAKSQWPIAVAAAQKAGNLKAGSLKPTKQGVSRGKMTQAQRRAKPP